MADGDYLRLVLAAQGDTDAGHRQKAMDAIAMAAPHAGGHDNSGADAIASSALQQLYPQP